MMRRRFFTLLARAVVLSGILPAYFMPARAQDGDAARAFIEQDGRELVSVIDGLMPEAEKKVRLQQIVDNIIDVQKIGQFCLGRYWSTASASQQQQYIQLFHAVMMNSITGKIGDFRGVGFTVQRTQPRNSDTAVLTAVTRPNNEPVNVQWIVSQASGNPKIVDVVIEGTSLSLTQRSEYYSFLGHHGGDVDALISAMRQKLG